MDTTKLDALRVAQDAKAAKLAAAATIQASLDAAMKEVDDAHAAVEKAFADLGNDLGVGAFTKAVETTV